MEINEAGAGIARRVVDEAARTAVVAGSMGPTGDVLEPLGHRTLAEAIDAFTEQAEGLRRGGADVAWIETMYAENELDAAMQAAADVGLAFLATMTFDTGGRTMMGLRPQEMPNLVPCRTRRPVGIGANCGVGPAQLLDSILGLRTTADPATVIVAKSNCGLPRMDSDMQVRYDGTPELMAEYACLARTRVPGSSAAAAGPPPHISGRCVMRWNCARGPTRDHAAVEARLGPLKVTTETEEAIARVKEHGAPSERRRTAGVDAGAPDRDWHVPRR